MLAFCGGGVVEERDAAAEVGRMLARSGENCREDLVPFCAAEHVALMEACDADLEDYDAEVADVNLLRVGMLVA